MWSIMAVKIIYSHLCTYYEAREAYNYVKLSRLHRQRTGKVAEGIKFQSVWKKKNIGTLYTGWVGRLLFQVFQKKMSHAITDYLNSFGWKNERKTVQDFTSFQFQIFQKLFNQFKNAYEIFFQLFQSVYISNFINFRVADFQVETIKV